MKKGKHGYNPRRREQVQKARKESDEGGVVMDYGEGQPVQSLLERYKKWRFWALF